MAGSRPGLRQALHDYRAKRADKVRATTLV